MVRTWPPLLFSASRFDCPTCARPLLFINCLLRLSLLASIISMGSIPVAGNRLKANGTLQTKSELDYISVLFLELSCGVGMSGAQVSQ